MSGNATLKAAMEVRKNLLDKAGEILEANPDELDMAERKISVTGDSTRALPTAHVVKACASAGIPLHHMAQFNAPSRELVDFKTGQGQVFPDFTFGTHTAEVSVDVETGQVSVLRLISCYDVGQSINRLSVEGQLEGGAIQGMGYGLMEHVVLEKGVTMTPSLAEFTVPTAVDTPDVETIILESGDGIGPFGAKGIGEPSLVSAAPAIANAVCDAIGTRICELPLTPERVMKALRSI